MSDLSRFFHRMGDLFTHAAASVPAESQQPVNDASKKVSEAATAIEGVIPILAKAGADTALAALGPIGVAFAPAMNAFIDALIAELSARKQPTPAALVSLVTPPEHPS